MMDYRVTIKAYTGSADPWWNLNKEQIARYEELIAKHHIGTSMFVDPGQEPRATIGYSGILVEKLEYSSSGNDGAIITNVVECDHVIGWLVYRGHISDVTKRMRYDRVYHVEELEAFLASTAPIYIEKLHEEDAFKTIALHIKWRE